MKRRIFIALFLITAAVGCVNATPESLENSLNNSIQPSNGNYDENLIQSSVAAPMIDEPLAPGLSAPKRTVLAQYTTEFKNATKSRAHNITQASVSIDETVVEPGATFSFNETIGPTTKANGYMLGRIFIDGKDAKGYGGGVCQVSSTLYNAAEQAGMEITERHNHSKAVNYVPEGKDASTSYGVIDLKFKNKQTYPIFINSYMGEESITVVIEAAPTNAIS